MIGVKGLRLKVGTRVLVDRADFSLAAGSLTVLLGPNGSGKSTLLRCIAGLQRPESGLISVGSRPIDQMDPLERARCLAWVGSDLGPASLSVFDVILAGSYAQYGRWTDPRPQDGRRAAEVCRQLELKESPGEFLDRDFQNLSQGERQLVHLARVFFQGPPVFVLDEPFSALDLRHRQVVRQLLKGYRQAGHTILLTHHDLGEAARMADHVLVLDRGTLVGPDEPRTILTPERIEGVWGVRGAWTPAGDFRYDEEEGRRVAEDRD